MHTTHACMSTTTTTTFLVPVGLQVVPDVTGRGPFTWANADTHLRSSRGVVVRPASALHEAMQLFNISCTTGICAVSRLPTAPRPRLAGTFQPFRLAIGIFLLICEAARSKFPCRALELLFACIQISGHLFSLLFFCPPLHITVSPETLSCSVFHILFPQHACYTTGRSHHY